METTEKTEIELRDDIATLLQQQGGVAGHQTAVELANAILRMVKGARPQTAAGGPPSTLPIAPTSKPE